MLDEGVVRNQAEIARLRGISGTRVTQLVNIAKLPRPVLECLLGMPEERQAPYTERRLRRITSLHSEREQVKAFGELQRAVESRDS
jgi:hypothetical protein